MKHSLVHLGFGVAFGFVLSSNGAADFDAMRDMFLFRSFHLFGVAIVTTLGAIAGLRMLARWGGAPLLGPRIRWSSRPIHRGTVIGAIVFGLGWGVSGTCPGTALVQLGEGHLIAAFTVLGIFVGVLAQQWLNRRVLRWPNPSCE